MDLSALLMPAITLITAQITVLELALFRYNKRKMIVFLCLEFIVQETVNGSVLLFAGYDAYARWFPLIMDVPAGITFFYLSKRRDFRDLFTIFVTLFISFTISVPSMWISQLLGNSNWWYSLIRIILYTIVLYLIHRFIRKRYIQIQEEIEKGWGMFCILPLIGSAILYVEYQQYSDNGKFSEVAAECFLTIAIMATVFLLFNYVLKQLHEKFIVQEQKQILAIQNKAQRDQFDQQREAAEKTNRRWHDLRHNIQELIELLEAGDVDTALSYLKEQRGMDVIPKEEYCLHPAVNSILCLWAERSRIAGIIAEIRTDVPVKLNIEPMELSALFSNAFENAYEGCLSLPSDIQKYIKVDANYNGKRLSIGFSNPCLKDIRFEGDMPVSLKSGGGIGTKSIAYTVSRFHGTRYFIARDGVFSARFILNFNS
jgi:hypothetical protein